MGSIAKIYYNAVNEVLESNYRWLKGLAEKYESWQDAWPEICKNYPGIQPEDLWADLEKANIGLSLIGGDGYPANLKGIGGAPFGIYTIGQKISDNVKIAIVGTRKASPQGKEIAKEFAKFLSKQGIEIVSGLAMGIDAASHEGCLAGGSATLAVLGSGLNQIYPRQNARLAEDILKNNGTLISEYPANTPPLPHHFIERNRIVSGLASAILVIEAPLKSGSLITVQFALGQNKDVFVIPGNIKHINYEGSNRLAKDGAILVTSPEEILEFLKIPVKKPEDILTADLSSEEQAIYNIVKAADCALAVDDIQMISGVEVAKLTRLLTFLAVKNLIKEDNGKYFI